MWDARVVVVDDEPANTTLLHTLLTRWGCTRVHVTNDARAAVQLCTDTHPDLLILDLHMPPPDGFGIMHALNAVISGPERFPVLVMTADATASTRRRAQRAGAQDFLGKPFDIEEVRLRIGNLLLTHRLQQDLRHHSEMLEARIVARTAETHDAHLDVLLRLAAAGEYRDGATGLHTRRVAHTTALLASALGLPAHQVELITLAAPLHDIGKIAIPDAILLKPARLTADEFHVIKTHATTGHQLLQGSASELLQTADEMAHTHHEHWDGHGYPRRLTGPHIPLAGRILAIADVFDALTHRRPYKPAWPLALAINEITAHAGTQFDPTVVHAFSGLDHRSLTLASGELEAAGAVSATRAGADSRRPPRIA